MKNGKKIIPDKIDKYGAVQEWQFKLSDEEYADLVDKMATVIGFDKNKTTKVIFDASIQNIVKVGTVNYDKEPKTFEGDKSDNE